MSEYVCTNHRLGDAGRETCGYEVASQTSGGYDFPTECPTCGGDLERL